MQTVNIHDAKTQFSKLVEAASNGEAIVIARAGKPAAMLVPIPLQAAPRRPGSLRDQIWIADDFDAPLPDDLLAGFEGN